jgi:NDP-sugar pyrophosphorylase family protein
MAGAAILAPALFRGAPAGAFPLTAVFDRAAEAGRLYGLRLEGVWMHVGTPEAVAAAEAAIFCTVSSSFRLHPSHGTARPSRAATDASRTLAGISWDELVRQRALRKERRIAESDGSGGKAAGKRTRWAPQPPAVARLQNDPPTP